MNGGKSYATPGKSILSPRERLKLLNGNVSYNTSDPPLDFSISRQKKKMSILIFERRDVLRFSPTRGNPARSPLSPRVINLCGSIGTSWIEQAKHTRTKYVLYQRRIRNLSIVVAIGPHRLWRWGLCLISIN